MLFDWDTIRSVLFGNRMHANIIAGQYDELPPDGATMGTLCIGMQGRGKTTYLARQIVADFKAYPNRAIFVLDWSGSITDTILKLILQEPPEWRDYLLSRVVYDDMGNQEWVVPLPEWAPEYGSTIDQQAQRVTTNLSRLAEYLLKNAPFVAGLAIEELGPHIYRLLAAMTDSSGRPWEISEAKYLIKDKKLLREALKRYGGRVPEAKWFLETAFLPLSDHERELRSYALIALWGAFEPRSIRARIGYPVPGWTPKEAIEKGLLVLCDGAKLINQERTQHYTFSQAYSMILAELNKRRPDNPADQPVSLVLDEVYSLIQIPGMAPEISRLAPQYRSRKLRLYVVLQNFSQVSEELRPHIWNLGNVICGALANKADAEETAKQLFSYNQGAVKLFPATVHQNPVSEPEHGQDRLLADWLQTLKFREFVVRRYYSERQMDSNIRHIRRTRELPQTPITESLEEVKDRLLKARGVRVSQALSLINSRKLVNPESGQRRTV